MNTGGLSMIISSTTLAYFFLSAIVRNDDIIELINKITSLMISIGLSDMPFLLINRSKTGNLIPFSK
jgi:hypothetical protein